MVRNFKMSNRSHRNAGHIGMNRLRKQGLLHSSVRDASCSRCAAPRTRSDQPVKPAEPATGRAALNEEWLKMFPDAASRPARHTTALGAESNALVTCEFVAVFG